MAYTVLARRYRSATFDDVVGQARVAQTLKKAIDTGRVAHAYLFTGTRGTGKTSMARILAKALNCESADGPTSSPCLQCGSCLGIARGDDIDCIEVDAASNTRLEDTQQVILDHVNYRPSRARYRIFIIDEVHMLSRHSFNALLKTLEEPPEHAKFILATTDPQKVPNTILSRCQRYDFRNIPTKEIAAHLAAICNDEKVKADEQALAMVAKAGAGSMRDALSLLDRVLSAGEKTIDADLVERLVGLPRGQAVLELTDALGQADVGAVLRKTEDLIASGFTADALAASLVEHLRNLMVLRACGEDSDLVDAPGLSSKDLAAQAAAFDPADLSQDIVLLEELRRTLRQSTAGRALLDATLVRIALAGQFAPIDRAFREQPVVAPAAGQAEKKKRPEPLTPAPVSRPTPQHEPEPAFAAEQAADDDTGDDLPAVGKVWEGPSLKEALAASAKLSSSTATHGNVEPVDPATMPQGWKSLMKLLAEKSQYIHNTLTLGRFGGIEDGTLVIRHKAADKVMFSRLENGKKQTIADAAAEAFGQPMGIRFVAEAGLDPAPAPAVPQESRPAAAPRLSAPATPPPPPEPAGIRLTTELRDQLYQNDPLIRAVIDTLGGEIVRVEPA